jgi:Tfp pilus assembly protein PilN
MKAVNLIPSAERRGGGSASAGRSQGIAYVVLGTLAGVALLVLLYGVARHHASSRRSQLATISAETQRAQEAVAALTPYTSFIALREARMKAVADVVDSRFDWAHAFHELGRVLPRDASITSLDGTVGAAGSTSGASSSSSSSSSSSAATAAGSATPAGSVPTITLGGCAGSQSEVALTLQRLRLIDGVGDVSLKSSATGGNSGSSSTSAQQCAPKSPSFSVQITFDPLPAAPESASKASTQLTASTGGGQ